MSSSLYQLQSWLCIRKEEIPSFTTPSYSKDQAMIITLKLKCTQNQYCICDYY